MPQVAKFDTATTSPTQKIITRMHQASISIIQYIKHENHTQITIKVHQALICPYSLKIHKFIIHCHKFFHWVETLFDQEIK
jgi:hypothetical protein